MLAIALGDDTHGTVNQQHGQDVGVLECAVACPYGYGGRGVVDRHADDAEFLRAGALVIGSVMKAIHRSRASN